MSSVTINKLLKTSYNGNDSKNYIYLQIKWIDDQFEIKMLDSESSKSYEGVVPVSSLKEIASNLDMPFNNYYEEMRSALSTYLTLPGFYYKLEPEMNVFNVWKSQPESIPILFLDIDIKEVKNKHELLDSAVEILQQQNKSLTDKVHKAHKFDEHSRELLEDYRLCVEEKNVLERKLLKKVAAVLNAKKERIAQLEERLRKYEEVEGDNEENTDSEENDDGPKTSKRKKLVVPDSESDNDDYLADTQPLAFDGTNVEAKS